MITDKERIKDAIDYVFSQEMYIPLPRDMFDDVCPNPDYLIHINGKSAAEAIRLLQIEIAISCQINISGMVLYIKSRSVTMAEINTIVNILPSARSFEACSTLAKPDQGEIEMWVFATRVQEKEEFQV